MYNTFNFPLKTFNADRQIVTFTAIARQLDGYIDANDLSAQYNAKFGTDKTFCDWNRWDVKKYNEYLATYIGIPYEKLIEMGTNWHDHAWIHPTIALEYAWYLDKTLNVFMNVAY